ncbi:hypothetical protein PHYPSEUDO_015292 [Phytophthora pseudosyringae]|uniref:Sugar transporter SWEET1 n=1 Tax=Phytophthora pseudosyringae TaxID=221518 RepID=A0A8T1W402_9STRA|nr:hypothetical protein PHYPSEUDO_015292 [Phytophthora pseudosyringae]
MSDANSTAHTVFVVLTIVSSIFVRVAPFPDFYRVHKYKDTGEVAVLPVVLLGTNCCMLTIYGYLVDNIFPLFAVSVFGIVTSITFVGIFYKWSQKRAPVRRVCALNLLLVVVVVIYTIVALTTTITRQSRHGVNSTIGWISIVTSVGMFGAPLMTIKKVVQTKSAASLSFSMSLIYTVNCLLWIVLCLISPDRFVMIPNAAGAILAILQLVLWFIYRPKKSHAIQAIDANTGELEIQLWTASSEDSQLRKSGLAVSSLHSSSGSEIGMPFTALPSPFK